MEFTLLYNSEQGDSILLRSLYKHVLCHPANSKDVFFLKKETFQYSLDHEYF